MIRTKIIATIGPACSGVDCLVRLFEAGADVCRLNFSHGTLDDHLSRLNNIRAAAQQIDRQIAILGDLAGPKIRLGEIADQNNTGGMPIEVGEDLIIQREPIVGTDHRVSTTYPRIVDDVQIGDRLLIEDGLLRFVCTDKTSDELRCRCTVGGVLKTAKGINLPNTNVAISSITERDWQCADWAVEHDLDYLGLSFVRRADDLRQLRQHLKSRGSDIQIIAKIEKAEAVKQIGEILEACDGLMVARGDLGVEMDVAQVPIIQKDLIRLGRVAGKPVIVATQMLQSMIESASPTRAEVSDVANAIFDGADAVMLSGETAIGKFPVGAVHTMNHIAETTEQYLAAHPPNGDPALRMKRGHISVAVARGVWEIVHDLSIKLIVLWSHSGATARIFAKMHFAVPIIALSSDRRALRRMVLNYGVYPHAMSPTTEMKTLVEHVDSVVRERKLAAMGDRIVIVAGASLGAPGVKSGVVIHTVGEQWAATPEGVTGQLPSELEQ